MNRYKDDLHLIEQTCKKAGDILLKYFGSDATALGVERKAEAGNSPVTIADKETDAFLQKELMQARPDYGWLSEEIEADDSHLNAKRSFVVDPIDGTKPFIAGVPEFVISIAVIENHKPVVGVIYNPITKEMFMCAKGEGLFLNGEPVSKRPQQAPKVFLSSIGEVKKGLLEPYEHVWEIRRLGSIAYKMAYVAAGKGDVMATFRPKSEWDIAAGHLMCEEMGLKVATFKGVTPQYDRREADDFVLNLLVAPAAYFEVSLDKILSKIT